MPTSDNGVDFSVVCIGVERITDALNRLGVCFNDLIEKLNQFSMTTTIPNNRLKMHGKPMVRKRAYTKIKKKKLGADY